MLHLQSPAATICILTYGDYLPYFSRCLDSVLRTVPPLRYELRLGFNAAPQAVQMVRDRFQLEPKPITEVQLGSDLFRTQFRTADGLTVTMWVSNENLYKEPMARLMYHDIPLTTDYTVWLDDDSYVRPGWWEALDSLLCDRIDYIGQPWWVDYLPGQTSMIQAQPWYREIPFDRKDGQEGIWFMTGGFVVIRSECLRAANFPDTEFFWKGGTLTQYGGDTLLGEVARQLGWRCASHSDHVLVNVDLEDRHPAPRRGGTGRQFGSAIEVAIK